MPKRFQYLTKPLIIRGKVLKSRLVYPVAQPHFLQANETYPANPTESFYARQAKNGAAMIWLQDSTDMAQRSMTLDIGHFNTYDMSDKGAQNGLSHFASHIHTYGTLICPELNLGRRMQLSCNDPAWHVELPRSLPAANVDPSVLIDKNGNRIPTSLDFAKSTQQGFHEPTVFDENAKGPTRKPMFRYWTRELMDEYIDKMIVHAKDYVSLGYDGGYLDLSHNFPIGQFLRACVNHRTDEYGGSLENRMRFPLEVIQRIREAMGEKYILCINSPVIDGDSCGDGMTLDELAVFLKLADPYVDIVQVRRRNTDHSRPDDYCQSAEYSAYLKSKGVKMAIAINTPYKTLEQMEAVLAEGKADIIAPGHMFICNEHLGDILRDGNGEDVNPCIECHCCRGTSSSGEWVSVCTINPEMGMEYRLPYMVTPVTRKKRVAIIGGGPGGIKCAMYLQDRGHTPIIFEKSDELGGQIKMANYASFKWELKRYLDFLKAQVKKRGIEVRYNTAATPEIINNEAFDVVVAALGGRAKAPSIDGVENAKWNPINIYGHETEIGHRVVVIGGASSATEAAVYLSKLGHEVTQLCRKECVGYDLNPIRMIPYMNILANTSGVTTYYRVKTTKIGISTVTYMDHSGQEHTVECDDIVAAGGMEPCSEEAVSFCNCASEFYMLGDCRQNGTMRHAIRDAYGIAMQI